MGLLPAVNEPAAVLATLVHPSHIVIYAPRASLTCRLPATSLNLGIKFILEISLSGWRLVAVKPVSDRFAPVGDIKN
ncbi:hypothetical protein C9426_18000 [Serratia sp. S1B]|nr:hypothetical protein C9426_18000 [Serratia sp. S1B]